MTVTWLFSFPQGETALHIAIRKTSIDVADILKRTPGGKELEQIRNKVGSLILVCYNQVITHAISTGSIFHVRCLGKFLLTLCCACIRFHFIIAAICAILPYSISRLPLTYNQKRVSALYYRKPMSYYTQTS